MQIVLGLDHVKSQNTGTLNMIPKCRPPLRLPTNKKKDQNSVEKTRRFSRIK